MNIWFRLKFVVVMNAGMFLILVIIQMFAPNLRWLQEWMHSPLILLLLSTMFWLVAPIGYRFLDGKS